MTHHGAGLLRLTRNESLVEQLKTDYTQADLTPAQRAMLDYAVKLTRTPWEMTEQDILTLREHGFNDRAILDINQIVGYFAYVNRLADGLGVELEDFWAETRP
ncbi:MAG: peroxidase [Caldilineae bacterium]|nr:MAG: peroxidase [Caldilineae bacterium]